MDDRLVDVLPEIGLAADEISLVADLAAPAVLDLPAVGPAVLIEVDPDQDHCVGRVARHRAQTLALLHPEAHAAHDALEIEARGVPDARLPVAEGARIAPEPDRHSALELPYAEGLELVHREVQVVDVLIRHRADVVEAVVEVHRKARRRMVGDRRVLPEVKADELFIECLRGEAAVFMVDPVRVPVVEIKGSDGLTEDDRENLVDLGEHFIFTDLRVLSGLCELPELIGVLPHQHHELLHEGVRVLRLVGLGHGALRHGPVFFDQVGRHVPVAAVAEALENILRHPVIVGEVGVLDGHREHVVGLLKFVVEGEIVAGEGKVGEAGFFDDLLAEYVERGEEPAAAALFLGGDAVGFYFHLKAPGQLCGLRRHEREVRHGRLRHRGGEGFCGGVIFIVHAECFDVGKRDSVHFTVPPWMFCVLNQYTPK